jgi:hypothetical protein
MSKERFLKVYSNLPEDIRKEIIIVIDGKSYTWNAASVEIINDTSLGEHIIEKLVRMELI